MSSKKELQKGRLAPVPEKRNHTSPWSPWECHLFCRPDRPAHQVLFYAAVLSAPDRPARPAEISLPFPMRPPRRPFLCRRISPPTTGRSDPAPPADAEQIGRLRIPFPRAAHLRPAAPYTSARALRRGDLAGRFCPSTAPAAAFSRRIPCPASLSDSLNETLVTSASDRHRMKFVRIFGS